MSMYVHLSNTQFPGHIFIWNEKPSSLFLETRDEKGEKGRSFGREKCVIFKKMGIYEEL